MGSIRSALVDAVIAALPVALVYFAGWAYLTAYLGQFGIDATQVEIGFPTVLVYAFVPLRSPTVIGAIGLILMIGFIAILVETLAVTPSTKSRVVVTTLSLVAVLGVIALLFVVSNAANVAAKGMADNVWKGAKSQTVVLSVSTNDEKASKLYKLCIDERRLRQIIGLPTHMFLLCRSGIDPCNRGTLFSVSTEGRINYMADKVREDIDARQICSS